MSEVPFPLPLSIFLTGIMMSAFRGTSGFPPLSRARANFVATAAGFVLMLFALANSLVTLASEDYSGALLSALVSAFLALGCLAIPFVRGPLQWRVVAVILASPAIFVFADFARRAPYVFGGGM